MNFELNDRGGWIVPFNTDLSGIEVSAPDYSVFGYGAKFGDLAVFGDRAEFGYGAEFGDGAKFGDDCSIEGEKLVKIITAANIDGSGRQIMLIFNGETVKVRAGCFFGTYQEMAEKALSESKPLYAAVVTAMAEAMISELKK